MGFPDKVLMRQHDMRILRIVHSFSFTRFLSQRVFPSKVLTRHVLDEWTSKGECYGNIVDVLITKKEKRLMRKLLPSN
jgi:hypothetical protein